MSKSVGFILLGVAAVAACGNGADGGGGPDAATTPTALSDRERAELTFMREEEKLARDVYDALDGNGQPFVNVQVSEQRHMDELLGLLVRYGVPDPAATTAIGEFVDADLQALYASLVAQGQADLASALVVGCTIEDVDLRDLAQASADATHPDLDASYALLMMGSRNHMRGFYSRLLAVGGSYHPQYIDQATFDAIVTSPTEHP